MLGTPMRKRTRLNTLGAGKVGKAASTPMVSWEATVPGWPAVFRLPKASQ